ncbi:MAG: amidohydrolase [Bacillati bacterium ANGP1]|uniref:Amidohydrolase n=1 Tax=Candidatus Segetimicrobium genomatis TaxID=2569760 RepID=A0A537JEK1_9BACT|nr:MAG: amidohydrolase [Terrabacteria group bacterium ANGP1]
MESIDVHFHVVPPAFLEAVRRGTFREAVEIQRRAGQEFTVYHAPDDVVVEPDNEVDPRLSDERLILEGLDRRRLDAAAIGPSPGQFFYWADPDLGERIARLMNDGIAALAKAHGDRMVGLGTLPMQDGGRAANGRDLDEPGLMPVFAAAARLGAPLFLHPQNWGEMRRLRDYHLWNLVGFPTETALAAARLIVGGVFERCPDLKIILAHGGGYFPYQIGRLDHGYRVRPELHGRLPRRPSEYLGGIYCDSLTHNAPALRFLVDRLGDDHVVIGTDYPFDMGDETPVETVRACGLGREREARVLGGNLTRLLRLG